MAAAPSSHLKNGASADVWPDSFGAVLTRDLRQGVRRKIFVVALLLLLFALLLGECLRLISVTATTFTAGEGFGHIADAIYYCALCLPALIILPLRALVDLTLARRHRHLELIQMTGQSSLRLVLGMLAANFFMALLFLVAALPFLLIRYFLGSVDLARELALFGLIILANLYLVALAIATGSFPKHAQRVAMLFYLAGFALLVIALSYAFVELGARMTENWRVWAQLLVFAVLLVLFTVFFAAERLAGHAQKFTLWQRFLAIAMLAVLVPDFVRNDFPYVATLALCLLQVTAISLTEPVVPSAHRYRGRFLRPLLAIFQQPGWPAGTWFAAFYAGLTLAAALGAAPTDEARIFLIGLFCVMAQFFQGAALWRLIRPRWELGMGFLIVWFGMAVLLHVFTSWHYFGFDFDEASVIMPFSVLMEYGNYLDGSSIPPRGWQCLGIVTGHLVLALIILHLRARPLRRAIKRWNRATPGEPVDTATPEEAAVLAADEMQSTGHFAVPTRGAKS
jgi:hypothetical protein